MNALCRLCQQPLFGTPLLVQNGMPGAAQGLPSANELDNDCGVCLTLRQCSACGVVQLDARPVPYWRDVIRAAGISAEMRSYRLGQFAAWLQSNNLNRQRVLEVGCGRGEYLALLHELGADAYGIEHKLESVQACQTQGLQVVQEFIDGPDTFVQAAPFDGFVMLNFLEHIPSAHLTLRGIAANLKPGGYGLVEVPNFDMIVRTGLFAEFIPDHIYYFSQDSFVALLQANGFEVQECQPTWHDYILTAKVKKREPLSLTHLQDAEQRLRHACQAFIAKFAPKRVAVWGAGHQALALINLMHLGQHLRYVVDSAPFKQGRFTPVSHVPIVAPERLTLAEVDAVIVLAASYTDEVIGLLRQKFGTNIQLARVNGHHLEPA